MNLTIIGTGFVGVVSAAVFASFGNKVIGLDIDENKVLALEKGEVPFYEPSLPELLLQEVGVGRLSFTTNYKKAIEDADIIIIAVGTPSTPEGKADLSYVNAAAESLAPFIKKEAIVVVKSTVPPGTLDLVQAEIKKHTKTKFYLASVPEFLKEGSAVADTLHPDRVVLGALEDEVFEKLEELHAPLQAPVVRMSPESAQMTKYAANAYLATRITFINDIADLCEHNSADIEDVIKGIGFDKRIGSHYWYPGLGYGGSCFPKDVRELSFYSREVGLEQNLLNKVNELNELRIPKILHKIKTEASGIKGKKAAVLGLAFKPNTDDMREAPSTKVIPWLLQEGALVAGYDPKALEAAKNLFPNQDNLTFHNSVADAAIDADIIFYLIEWPEIVGFDLLSVRDKNKEQWVIDARNQLDRSQVEGAGFNYLGIGR